MSKRIEGFAPIPTPMGGGGRSRPRSTKPQQTLKKTKTVNGEPTTIYVEPEGYRVSSKLNNDPNSIEYISCVAFNLPNPKNKDTDTTEMMERAPFWSIFVSNKTINAVIDDVTKQLSRLSSQNGGSINGPVYMLIGRNKNKRHIDCRLYLPSISKDGTPVDDATIPSYHDWLRRLLFANPYAVSDWLCNNPCNEDLAPRKHTVKDGLFTYIYSDASSQPECGCVSSKGNCSFYNLPYKFSASPRNINTIDSYSIYKIKARFFEKAGISLKDPENLVVDNIRNGSMMYEGCDTRLLSENRLFSLEMEPKGMSLYQTDGKHPFSENCIPKPGEEYVDNAKVLKASYPIVGKLPRLRVNDSDISVLSVEKNRDTKKNEFVKQWYIPTGRDDPYTVFIDNDGNIMLRNKKGDETYTELSEV